MIDGNTKVIAHFGFPTEAFKAPLIYNPWFEKRGINAAVMPFAVRTADYPGVLRSLFRCDNVLGALITMPHKVTTVNLVDDLSVTAKIAGACNAVVRREDGSLFGDMFDGEGFVRSLRSKGKTLKGQRAFVIGSGGVGSAIAASLAAAGLAAIGLYDINSIASERVAQRLRTNYPGLEISIGANDPKGYGIVINATPLGMNSSDPLPTEVSRIGSGAFVGEVVMAQQFTPFLRAAIARGCEVQAGTDMLYEMIPAYLELFRLGTATPDELRSASYLC
jgi:shikimate dehydrogenase